MNEWISVEDRLPESSDEVLVIDTDGDRYVASYRSHIKKWFCDIAHEPEYSVSELELWFHVTHWMPLPEPPKETA